MTTALAAAPPRWWQLLYSPRAWRTRLARTRAELEAEHLAWNYDAVAPHVAPGARVLDLGAWDCRLAAALRDRRGATVVGADVVDANATDVELRVLVDGRVPAAPDERFDVVLLLYVLHHAADDHAVLAEARRLLAPGGVIVVGEDRADTWRSRARTVLFHVWLLAATRMGWRGRFRDDAGWRARFAAAGLTAVSHRHLGACRWWFPENQVYVLAADDRLRHRAISHASGRSQRNSGA